ncbi:hypothetical protein GO497_04985 [Acidovorax citrulli]|nr:hypothetical protein [Paracidovorax citrulli]
MRTCTPSADTQWSTRTDTLRSGHCRKSRWSEARVTMALPCTARPVNGSSGACVNCAACSAASCESSPSKRRMDTSRAGTAACGRTQHSGTLAAG